MWWRCRLRRLRRLAPVLFALALPSTPLAAFDIHEQILTRAQWPQHANAHNISTLPAVAETLRHFEETEQITIIIRYPGGDPGRQWANQLHNWLITLGVPTRYLQLEPGSGDAGRIIVSVIDRR